MTYWSYWICDVILGRQTPRSEGTLILMRLLALTVGFFFRISYCGVLSFVISHDETHQIKCGLWDPVCQTQTKSISSLQIHPPSFYFHLNPEGASEQEYVRSYVCVCLCVGWLNYAHRRVRLQQGPTFFSSRGDDDLSLCSSLHSLCVSLRPLTLKKESHFSLPIFHSPYRKTFLVFLVKDWTFSLYPSHLCHGVLPPRLKDRTSVFIHSLVH